MKHVINAILLLVGLINFFPVVGVLSAERLANLYGVGLDSPDLVILMRHRAVLLGLLGACIVTSVFKPALRPWACGGGLISMLSFVLLAYANGAYGDALNTVVIADIIASIGLAIVVALNFAAPRAATDSTS